MRRIMFFSLCVITALFASCKDEPTAVEVPSETGLWKNVTGTVQGRVNRIHVIGSNVLVHTDSQGVYVSSNWGESWNPLKSFPSEFRHSLEVDGYAFLSTHEGVYRSTDSGINWNLTASTGLTSHWALGSIGSTVYVTGQISHPTHGLVRTTDYGQSWQLVNDSIPNALGFYRIVSLGTILFSVNNGMWGPISMSADSGRTWSALNFFAGGIYVLRERIFTMVNYGKGNQFSLSADSGKTWIPLSLSEHTIALLESKGAIFAVSRSGHVLRSLTLGRSFQVVGCSMEDIGISTLAASDTYLFGGSRSGVYRCPIDSLR